MSGSKGGSVGYCRQGSNRACVRLSRKRGTRQLHLGFGSKLRSSPTTLHTPWHQDSSSSSFRIRHGVDFQRSGNGCPERARNKGSSVNHLHGGAKLLGYP